MITELSFYLVDFVPMFFDYVMGMFLGDFNLHRDQKHCKLSTPIDVVPSNKRKKKTSLGVMITPFLYTLCSIEVFTSHKNFCLPG